MTEQELEEKKIDLDAMFGVDQEKQETMGELAEWICLEEEHIAQQKKVITTKKEELISMILQQGLSGSPTPGGLKPTLVTKIRFSVKSQVEAELIHNWLREKGLADIIKTEPHVHPATLKSTVLAEKELGHDIPETMFNLFEYNDITWYGKSKFLAGRKA